MTNFDGVEFSNVNVTIKMLYEKSKQNMLRLYLRSTKKEEKQDPDEDGITREAAAAPTWCHRPSPQPGVCGMATDSDINEAFPNYIVDTIIDDINHITRAVAVPPQSSSDDESLPNVSNICSGTPTVEFHRTGSESNADRKAATNFERPRTVPDHNRRAKESNERQQTLSYRGSILMLQTLKI
ncbi:hypothetical protein CAPTEDRAFT_211814 [Capitella teleta]|uniref:Uncharacterized protein n=1 Tax=Capitella teleta TaxID=283909 RepID=R7V5V1_CAPTE|nr:hypothetical protein CAPTEDRAFT_211814 [Capitella teleta]|eukprot:ELU11696.1 hypothetical protein CAPTEDRAFT_211814 [Capitella teleta]